MEAALSTHIEADYPRLGLRTRSRRHSQAGCHTPGCGHRAQEGKSFCSKCQATLDRVRTELMAAKPRGRKRAVRRVA